MLDFELLCFPSFVLFEKQTDNNRNSNGSFESRSFLQACENEDEIGPRQRTVLLNETVFVRGF